MTKWLSYISSSSKFPCFFLKPKSIHANVFIIFYLPALTFLCMEDTLIPATSPRLLHCRGFSLQVQHQIDPCVIPVHHLQVKHGNTQLQRYSPSLADPPPAGDGDPADMCSTSSKSDGSSKTKPTDTNMGRSHTSSFGTGAKLRIEDWEHCSDCSIPGWKEGFYQQWEIAEISAPQDGGLLSSRNMIIQNNNNICHKV